MIPVLMTFGFYRFLLALAVVLNHLAGVWELGRYAVFGFFYLSGFLMTMILQRSYGYGLAGFRRFVVNRFLRIFPAYWTVLLLTLLVLWLVPGSGEFHPTIGWPESWTSWLQNLTIATHAKLGTPIKPIPQSWALTVELFWYALIGLGASKTVARTWVWVGLSLAYTVTALGLGLGWDGLYFSPLAASLPFSLGALLYHYQDAVRRAFERVGSRRSVALLALAATANYLLFRNGPDFAHKREILFFSNLLLQCGLLSSLASLKLKEGLLKTADKKLGDLSYPVYLGHYLVAIPVSALFGSGFQRGDFGLFWASLVPLLLLSVLITKFIENPIEGLRKKVKASLSESGR